MYSCVVSGLIGSVQIDSIIPYILRTEFNDLNAQLNNLTSAADVTALSSDNVHDVMDEAGAVDENALGGDLDTNGVLTSDATLNGDVVRSDDEESRAHLRNVILVEGVPSLTFDERAVVTSS